MTATPRHAYPERKVLLHTEAARQTAIAAIGHAPIDAERPIEVVIRERPKQRKPDQNALMWAGSLKDIAEQGYVNGRTYSASVWHEYFKAEFLPEEYDPERCKSETYQKWDFNPAGVPVLVGSTTDLTPKGFAEYLTQVEAYGAVELGVRFHANPKRMAA